MVADAKQELTRRFREFVVPNGPGAIPGATQGVAEVLARINRHGWNAYIVGGALRDLILNPAGHCPRDIDVVVVGSTQSVFENGFRDLCVRRNRFGGLHLITSEQVDFDVWRLEDTWGVRTQGLSPTVYNFVKTPFLNVDSIAIEAFAENGQRGVYEHGFFEALASRVLDINYESNPFPLVCIARSLIIAATFDFALSERLASFICDYRRWGAMEDLMLAQSAHYGRVQFEAGECSRWMEEIGKSLKAPGDDRAIRLTRTHAANG